MIKTKGEINGICNICGEFGNLTDDHTPPKGCIKISPVEIKHLTSRLAIYPEEAKGRLSQNGVKYRTLCKTCNNEILGLNCDPTFNYFVNTIRDFWMSSEFKQDIIAITTYPQKIIRSLIGHISAQGINRFNKGIYTEPIKKYMTDFDEPLPDGINIYYWFYPYKGHVMARDVALSFAASGVEPCSLWLLKFFPIGFMVTFDKPDIYHFKVNELTKLRHLHHDEPGTIYFDYANIPHHKWPEAPMNETILLYGEEAITSYPK